MSEKIDYEMLREVSDLLSKINKAKRKIGFKDYRNKKGWPSKISDQFKSIKDPSNNKRNK